MPHDLLAKFEHERELYQKERQGEAYGAPTEQSRRDSYVDEDSYLRMNPTNSESLREEDIRSLANKNRSNPILLKRGEHPISLSFLKW